MRIGPVVLVCLLCWSIPAMAAEEIDLQQLITGMEFANQHIRSGELRVSVKEKWPAQRNPEEIEIWKKQEHQKLAKQLEQATDEAERNTIEFKRQLVEWQAKMEGPRLFLNESNVAFQVLDTTTCLYRLTELQRGENEELNPEGHLKHTGRHRILSHDGDRQSLQMLYGGMMQVEFQRQKRLAGYKGYDHLGRWPYEMPSDMTLVGQQTFDDAVCYVIEFVQSEWQVIVQLWVDPNLEFCIRKEEHYDLSKQQLLSREVFDRFRRFGDVLYPTSRTYVTYASDGSPRTESDLVVYEARFDCEFPPHFFDIEPKLFEERGWSLAPASDPAAYY